MKSTLSSYSFSDYHPVAANLYEDVIEGLNSRPRVISPKYFYDEKGSKLFDEICETPEYYPTRTEAMILSENLDEITGLAGKGSVLIEPGSGNSAKVRLLLDALRPSAYVPMDISGIHLQESAKRIAVEYPWLTVHAVCADFTHPVELPHHFETGHRVAFFPGSSIGNFEPEIATEFLAGIASMVGENGGLLIGVDLKKEESRLEAAYNDRSGVTARFNTNLLTRINRELDANFDVDSFSHRARYNRELGRIEMHLISEIDQEVRIGAHRIAFREGEGIHTESSYKYTIDEFQTILRRAGFVCRKVWTDEDDLFSLHYCEASGPDNSDLAPDAAQ